MIWSSKRNITSTKNNVLMYLLIMLIIILSCINGILFYTLKTQSYIKDEINEILNRSSVVETYYIKMNDMYFDLLDEYDYVYDKYTEINLDKNTIEKDYNDVMNYKKSILLDENKNIEINPLGNITIKYKVPFSGYIEINFNSSEETYIWVGSTSIEQIYYSRYPTFPEVTKTGSIKIPVLPDILIYIPNPDEDIPLKILLTVNFIY